MKPVRVLTIVLAMAAIVLPRAAAAQGLTYGAKAGVTLATVSEDPEGLSRWGYRVGLAVGGYVALPLGSRLAIQAEGLFNQKGARADDEGLVTTLKLDYVEVPVLVKYAVTHGGARSIHVFGGPSIAFKVRSRATASFGDTTIDTDEDENIENVDVGIAAGAGIDFGRWSVDGRYTFGLSNLVKSEADEGKLRSRAISILAGIRF
jgi:hypothetical protein